MVDAVKVSIIIPTYCRPEQLRRNTERLLYTVRDLETEIIVSAEVAERSLAAVEDLPVKAIFHPDWRGSVANWNLGAADATGDLLVVGADDLWWGDGWLHEALEQMALTETCFCGLNDMMWNGWDNASTHWAITRQGIIDHCGGCLMPPCYKTTFVDNEINHRIKRAGQYTWCAQAMVDHMHFSIGKSEKDKCYRTMTLHFYNDKRIYERRLEAGFPDDFDAVVH